MFRSIVNSSFFIGLDLSQPQKDYYKQFLFDIKTCLPNKSLFISVLRDENDEIIFHTKYSLQETHSFIVVSNTVNTSNSKKREKKRTNQYIIRKKKKKDIDKSRSYGQT